MPTEKTTLDFSADYRLEDQRVQLRPLQDTDLPHLVPFARQEPELFTWSLQQPADEPGMRDYISAALAGRRQEQAYPFIVYDKGSGRYAGSTRLYDLQPYHRSISLGYTWYGSQFHGTGLNKHCKFLLLDFAFGSLEMERVEFRADSRNERSLRAMQSIGCRLEGVLRSTAYRPDGSRRDSTVLSILRPEWEEELRSALYDRLYRD